MAFRCQFEVIEPFPEGLELESSTGIIRGSLKAEADRKCCKVKAKNVGGEIETTFEFFVVKVNIIERICKCTDLEKLWKMEPKKKKSNNDNWMVWMVHRVHLNDHTLRDLNFTNMPMPSPEAQPLIGPKLFRALQSNDHLEELLLAGTRLVSSQASALAEALRKNSTLRVVNMESNCLNIESIVSFAKALSENSASNIEEWRFDNQAGVGYNFGPATEEAIAEMMRNNKRLLKLGFSTHIPGSRNSIDRSLMQNADAARRRRSAGA